MGLKFTEEILDGKLNFCTVKFIENKTTKVFLLVIPEVLSIQTAIIILTFCIFE